MTDKELKEAWAKDAETMGAMARDYARWCGFSIPEKHLAYFGEKMLWSAVGGCFGGTYAALLRERRKRAPE